MSSTPARGSIWPCPSRWRCIGVDNDELVCNLCNPPLSSIIPNPERIGFEAAGWLDRMMQGETPAALDIEIPPLGIAVRQSSDVFAVSDPTLASALRFIRERACDGATVTDLLVAPFRVAELAGTELPQAAQSLAAGGDSDGADQALQRACCARPILSLEKIAGLGGFEHPEYMSVVFKRETGRTPGQYRSNGSRQAAVSDGASATERMASS